MISIIILTYNNLELTKKCLKSLYQNTPVKYLDDIVIVDNASSDGTREFLKTTKNIKVIYNDKNLGFSIGNNIGAENAKGKILVFLNLDTEVQKGWLEPIIKIIEEGKKVGAVGVKMLFPDGLIQHAGIAIAEDLIPRHLYYHTDPDKPYVNKQREFRIVTAACIAIPKQVFDEVNGFDEGYINGLEDADLCLRIHTAGYRIIYNPKSVVIHHESVSGGRFDCSGHNYELYMSRWGKVQPDEHKIMREDGFNTLQIFWHDLVTMAYTKGQFAKTPLHIRILRCFYIPTQKTITACKLIFKGDFKTLSNKIKKVVNHG